MNIDQKITERLINSVTDKIKFTLFKKNQDYGDSFHKRFKEYGMTSALIRIEDKVERLKHIIKNGIDVKDETIDDTLQDLAGYAILTLVERMKVNEEVKVNDKNTSG